MVDFRSEELIAQFCEAISDLFDKNGDGCITREELATAIKNLDQKIPTIEVLQNMVDEVNSNPNGTICFEEFMKVVTRNIKESDSEEELIEAFKVFDKDQDGFISPAELKQVMLSLGERLSDEEIEQMIRVADSDGDGKVNYEEFAKLMASIS